MMQCLHIGTIFLSLYQTSLERAVVYQLDQTGSVKWRGVELVTVVRCCMAHKKLGEIKKNIGLTFER
jgi:hypothetical protein